MLLLIRCGVWGAHQRIPHTLTPIPYGIWGVWDLWGPLRYQKEKWLKVDLFDAIVDLFDAIVDLFDAVVDLFDAILPTAEAHSPTVRRHDAQASSYSFNDTVALVRHVLDHLSRPPLAMTSCARRQLLAAAGSFVDCGVAESDEVGVGEYRIAIGGRVGVPGGLGDAIHSIALFIQCNYVRP